MRLDPRRNAFRDDLADARLAGRVAAPRYAAGERARIGLGQAALRRRPAADAATDSFLHYGEEIIVFDRADGYAWCQSLADDYVGYVAAAAVRRDDGTAPTHHVATLGSYLYGTPDLRSERVDFLPRHSAVRVAETGIVTRGTAYARLDAGGYLPLACLAHEPPHSSDLVAAAGLYRGCPYLWAGRSFLGIDCSGLVQMAFRDIGVFVLRDTDQQRETVGIAVSARHEGELRRGDLLYLPGHVLIYDGAGTVIHADGAAMMVREEALADSMDGRRLGIADFVVRRYSGGTIPDAARSSAPGNPSSRQISSSV